MLVLNAGAARKEEKMSYKDVMDERKKKKEEEEAEREKRREEMIEHNKEVQKRLPVTTTPTIEGREIEEYLGIVFGEVIEGANIFNDFAASVADTFGGRASSYEDVLKAARNEAIREMRVRADNMGADAVVGVDVDYEVLGQSNGMLMVSTSGTAVKLKKQTNNDQTDE